MRIRPTLKVLFALLLASLAAAEQPSIENARALLAKGELKEAAVVLHEVAAADPGNVDARILLGTTLSLQGKRSESIEQLLEAVRLQPDSARAYNTLGMVLSRFIETKAYSHYLRAKIWVAQKELGNAASELETAVKLRPDYAEAWSDLGGIRRLNGEAKGAQQALERAVALNPDDDKAQYRLGVQCLQNAEPHSAVDHLRKALRHDPADRAALYNLALALRRDGQGDEAKRVDDRLSKLLQSRNKAAADGQAIGDLNDGGMALEKSGNIRAALEKYWAALDLDPTDVVVRLNYGLALCRLARWQEGAAELREVLRLDPNNAAAANALYIARDEKEKQAAQAGKAVSEKPAQKN